MFKKKLRKQQKAWISVVQSMRAKEKKLFSVIPKTDEKACFQTDENIVFSNKCDKNIFSLTINLKDFAQSTVGINQILHRLLNE